MSNENISLQMRQRPGQAVITAHTIVTTDGPRHYLMATPRKQNENLRPLVIILHGAGASAAQVMGLAFPVSPLSVWLEIAEREQLLVVAPDGSKKGWNDSFAHVRNKPETDDTGMIRNLIAHMIREHEADPQRVYVNGVSKGGMMAYRLATELGSMLAAFASILANMPQQSVCAAPVTPISALIVASTRDPLVPYGGGKYFYTPLLSPMKSINDTVDIWRTLANLPATGKSVDIPKSAASNPTSCTRITWGDNPEQLQIVLLRINGGGHAEPSRSQFYPWFLSRLVGAQNTDIDIAEEAWAFFKDKRCKDAGGNSRPETTSGENK